MFLVDFNWFRAFSDNENCSYSPLTCESMFSVISFHNHVAIGVTAYSIVINLFLS